MSSETSSETDLIKLYSARILALAADIPLLDRLDNPDATAKKRAPLCGSTVTVDLTLHDGQIADFGQDVKACALGQASASIVASKIIGRSLSEVETARAELKAMLTANQPPPAPPFAELEVLIPARDFKNRHASILLCLDATLEAFHEASQKNCA
ncbi:iron-sulfur cluster assembly scaffold protein [Pseudophaeobacter flagellatus]|uniref:iron-sulfur cluster assembly scaffold protein n=1 Tax=Pseudophaeobacter flagellatus TaxID=2899119 RepID=UPI001E341B50|nr:iron-sulfur cluster assembly scaffold protein [Pseudophaeobacter flagellatus]MCD9146824.1 iron-sulfur cluster assembly scaffold protein [Pseudophaeobacter flagellatus]